MSQPSTPPVYRRSSGHFIRHLVTTIVVLAAIIAGVNLLHKSSSATPLSNSTAETTWQATPPAILNVVTKIPTSTFNTIGVTSPLAPVTGPASLGGQTPLTKRTPMGTLPEVFYVGADYCPFCAAERWPTVIALSRFGTFHNLGDTTSGSKDVYPNTQTFTFARVTYSSKYIAFVPVEEYTNTLNKAGTGYTPLEKLTPTEYVLFQKYNGASGGAIPFMSFGNRFFISGSTYLPSVLMGRTRAQIAASLSNPHKVTTQAIIASANYETAAICSLTHQQPSRVCDTKGTKAADKKLGIQ